MLLSLTRRRTRCDCLAVASAIRVEIFHVGRSKISDAHLPRRSSRHHVRPTALSVAGVEDRLSSPWSSFR